MRRHASDHAFDDHDHGGFRVVVPDAVQRAALDTFDDLGNVVHFVFVRTMEDVGLEATHRVAALLGVAEVMSRTATWFQEQLGYTFVPAETRATQAQLRLRALDEAGRVARVDPATLTGRAVTTRALFGPMYVPATGVVHRHGSGATLRGVGPYERDGATGPPVRLARAQGDWGLADACLEPPYGLRGSAREIAAGFRDVVRASIGAAPPAAWRWDGTYSSFFSAGHEWWGAAAWTIATAPHSITVACASSTD